MKNVFDKNMEYIRSLNVGIYNKILNTDTSTVKKVSSKDNNPNLIKEIKTNSYIYLHSNYAPENQAEYISQYVLEKNPDIVFLFGMGMGYELKRMIEKNDTIRYFIVEPDPSIFKIALENIDMKFLFNNNNIYFIQDDKLENIISFFQSVIVQDKSINISFITLPSYEVVYKNLIENLNEGIRKVINLFRVNLSTSIYFQRIWFKNFISNLNYLNSTCPVEKLKDIYKGKPAIIVGAGPSLNYDLETLKKCQGKAIIAAAGTGVSVLEKNGIKCTLTGAIDGSEDEGNIFKDLKLNKESILLYNSKVYPSVPKMYKHKFLMNTGDADQYIRRKLKWDSSASFSAPSISVVLLYFLSFLGCNPIILLGQDLCYSSNKNYADGIEDIKGKNELDTSKNYLKTTLNKNNKCVYVDEAFIAMKNSFEDIIRLKINDVTYLNGTKDGVFINGTENINFEEYFEEFLKNNTLECIDKSIEDMFKNDDRDLKNKIENLTNSIQNDLNKVEKICKNVIKYIDENEDESLIKSYIEKKKTNLKHVVLYDKIIKPFISNVDYVFKYVKYKERETKTFALILDICLVMKNSFNK